jgi:hypothetical protein
LLFAFNQFGDVEQCVLRPGNVRGAERLAGSAGAGDLVSGVQTPRHGVFVPK